jgi:hypothetical protein
MTSAVFGGIAARNTDESATVSLDERIAIGDDRCSVTIDLRPASAANPWVHRYLPPLG